MAAKKIKQVIVDRNLCIGAATCVVISPKAFRMDEENKAVLQGTWTDEERQTLIDAAKSCPVNAIIILDEDGCQLWPPKG